jgi:hypothetical protein
MELDIHPQETSGYVNNMTASLPFIAEDSLLVVYGLNPKGVDISSVNFSHPMSVNDSIILPRVPDLTGLGARDAIFLLESLGLKAEVAGRGFVIDQSIKAGMTYREGEQIKLTLEI